MLCFDVDYSLAVKDSTCYMRDSVALETNISLPLFETLSMNAAIQCTLYRVINPEDLLIVSKTASLDPSQSLGKSVKPLSLDA